MAVCNRRTAFPGRRPDRPEPGVGAKLHPRNVRADAPTPKGVVVACGIIAGRRIKVRYADPFGVVKMGSLTRGCQSLRDLHAPATHV